jgi:hypothetical protein
MTGGTGLGELSTVMVLMTAQAFPSEAEEGPRFHPGGIAPDPFLTHIGRTVARNAGGACMFSRKCEPGPLVIEVRRVEPHDAELPAVVLLVALDALVGAKAPMHTGTARHAVRNFRMAAQAFLIVDVLAETVACGTFLHTFHGCVRIGQLAR